MTGKYTKVNRTNWFCEICGWFPCDDNWPKGTPYPTNPVEHPCKRRQQKRRYTSDNAAYQAFRTIVCHKMTEADLNISQLTRILGWNRKGTMLGLFLKGTRGLSLYTACELANALNIDLFDVQAALMIKQKLQPTTPVTGGREPMR